MDQSFGKAYKLCNKKQIDSIFDSGRTQKQFPLIAKYKPLELSTEAPFQMVIAAPKRTFRSAVKRNRIKRICREAVRKNKHLLEDWLKNHNSQVGIFLLYTGKEEIDAAGLEQKTQKLLKKIIHDLDATNA